MDDILIKSARVEDLVRDLEETFTTLWQFGLKLNPSKYIFRVKSWWFLDYLVTKQGIETNPEKVRILWEMKAPQNTQKVQRLVERITVLSHFISRSTNRSLPFFKVLQKYLDDLPTLYKPVLGEHLWLYLEDIERVLAQSFCPKKEQCNNRFTSQVTSLRMLKGAIVP